MDQIASTWQGPSEVHHQRASAGTDISLEARQRDSHHGIEGKHGAVAIHQSLRFEAENKSSLMVSEALSTSKNYNYFTDYLQSSLHPKTVHLVEGIWHEADDSKSAWMQADGWLSPALEMEEVSDAIRTFAEDADTLAGFQCIVDDLTMWGGISNEVLEMLKDDYRSQPVLLFATRKNPVSQQSSPAAIKHQLQLSKGLSCALLTRYTDVFVPLIAPEPLGDGLAELHWEIANDFRKSALFAAAIDSMSTPYRLNSTSAVVGGMDMWSLPDLLRGPFQSPFASLSMAMPCAPLPGTVEKESVQLDHRMPHKLQRHPSPLFTTKVSGMSGLTIKDDTKCHAECIVLRGARSRDKLLLVHEAQEMLDFALISEGRRRCVQHRVVSAQALAVPPSLLNLFIEGARRGKESIKIQEIESHNKIESCPLLSRLAGTSSFKEVLQKILQEWISASRTGQGHAALQSWGVDDQLRGEVEDQLLQLVHAYDDD